MVFGYGLRCLVRMGIVMNAGVFVRWWILDVCPLDFVVFLVIVVRLFLYKTFSFIYSSSKLVLSSKL